MVRRIDPRPLKREGRTLPLIEVEKIGPMHDFWGRPLKRYVSSPALRRGIQSHLMRSPGALLESLGRLKGKRPGLASIQSLKVRLFQEGDYQYVFKVLARMGDRSKADLGMIVAKREGALSSLTQLEFENLLYLYGRDSRHVVRPLIGDRMSLGGERGQPPKKLFCYFTLWLSQFHELGVHRDMNFYINEIPFHYFNRPESDRIKGHILEVLFSCYDPGGRRAIEPPKVGAGDFVITRPQKNEPLRLRLIACRKILNRVTLDRCIRLYLGYRGEWAGNVFHFVPRDMGILQEAIIKGLIVHNTLKRHEVLDALQRYADSLLEGEVDAPGWSPLAMIKRLLKDKAWLMAQ